jgi:phage terminase large subunit
VYFIKKDNMTDTKDETGEKQEKPKGVFPATHRQFGKPEGNPINKNGVPRTAIQLRRMIQDIGGEPTKYNKKTVMRLEKLLYQMYASKSPSDRANILKAGYPGSLEDKIVMQPAEGAVGGSVLIGGKFSLPADMLAPDFVNVYRDLRNKLHTEYVLHGGRGSTKSTFVSEIIIELLINNPGVHALATRQVANTMRDSVYSQLLWSINELGLSDKFKCTTSPLEMTYLPTGQHIFFRGADDPGKMKSIKPPFGYIAILWFEELDQFHGPESVRKIEQSVIRGGDEAWIFKTFNPPRTSGNWANKYIQIPKETQLQHASNYLTVPQEWLGQTFIDEAEHLKQVNPLAYAHEYMGEVNATGGQVFDNVKLRKITEEEIKQFDHVYRGIDWGFYPDPFAYVKMHYDAARLKLYIYDEYRAQKKSNRLVYDELVSTKGLQSTDILIADSAEPKSVADFRDYGAMIRAAEKGPESVNYSMKWLQSLAEIVIDNIRCPETAQEFIDYELEQDKDGEYISEYPDANNHFIDATRYAMNLTWRRRGQ